MLLPQWACMAVAVCMPVCMQCVPGGVRVRLCPRQAWARIYMRGRPTRGAEAQHAAQGP